MPSKPATKRGVQFERLFRIVEHLRGLRFGARLEVLTRDVSEAMGRDRDFHIRTIRRDVELLEYLGLVHVDVSTTGTRAKWTGPELLAIAPDRFGRAADAMSHLHSAHYYRREVPLGN